MNSFSLREKVGIRGQGKETAIKKKNEFPRRLRKHQTNAERIIWSALRNRQLHGLKFRRQHPVDHYILDFFCPELKLAIELDGGQHYSEPGQQYDGKRNTWLESRGIKILRYSNLDVLQNKEGVLFEIARIAEVFKSSPHPNPLPKGEDI